LDVVDIYEPEPLTIVVETPNAEEILEPYNIITIYGPVDTSNIKRDETTVLLENVNATLWPSDNTLVIIGPVDIADLTGNSATTIVQETIGATEMKGKYNLATILNTLNTEDFEVFKKTIYD